MTHAEALAAEIREILEIRAEGRYGLCAVSQKQHALQAAWLAERDGHSSAMVTAALLHDVGHMIHDLGEHPAQAGLDDRHEELGQAWLSRHFSAEVSEPVRMHVTAKRYLCATEADYSTKLSADSVRSLELQGGPMSSDEVAEFSRSPHAMAAIQLRRYDEMAKVADLDTPGVIHFLPHVHRSLRRSD